MAIVGSRDYPNLEQVREYVRAMRRVQDKTGRPMRVVSGGARGVDATAEETACEVGLEVTVFLADWDRYGKSAGYRRNKLIVEQADYIVAFWDGESKGTKHTIDLALADGKQVYWYRPDSQRSEAYVPQED